MKLPAYGKQLLRERRAGAHPAVVTVVYGLHWDVPGAEFRLAVRPGEALGLDWRCVAGLPIEFVNRAPCAMFFEGDEEPLRLVAEIALESAQIVIAHGGARVFADDMAFAQRSVDAKTHLLTWPAWWSEEINQIHGQNRKRWIEEATQYLARFAA